MFLPNNQFKSLLTSLQDVGYECIAPQVIDGAILYQPIKSIDSLPQSISSKQRAGYYRLVENNHKRYFDWSSAPQALKPLLFSPQESMWKAEKDSQGRVKFSPCTPETQLTAVLGVRSCDLAALARQDKHFLCLDNPDPWYKNRRESLMLISVDCTTSSDNCFCLSTKTGPSAENGSSAEKGYDLNLHELDEGFLISAGSTKGEQILSTLQLSEVTQQMLEKRQLGINQAKSQQKLKMATDDFRPLFAGQEESDYWQQIAEKCLGCGNCTAVCPTCFCHREEDFSGLDLENSTHHRVWDSCFTAEHSMLHGKPVRKEIKQRYRQWMTHKLAGWHDQFNESGCVGCGRCITWCPAGINLVEVSTHFANLGKTTDGK